MPKNKVPDQIMKIICFLSLSTGLLLLGNSVSFAAETNAVSAELRSKLQELRSLPPEERRAKQRELMEGLTPEQRQQLQGQVRNRGTNGTPGLAGRPGAGALQNQTPEQREARQKQMQSRIEALEKKKADGTITQQESAQLQRAKQMFARMQETAAKPEVKKDAPLAEEPKKDAPKP
jgi:hypothetical protein